MVMVMVVVMVVVMGEGRGVGEGCLLYWTTVPKHVTVSNLGHDEDYRSLYRELRFKKIRYIGVPVSLVC